MQKHHRLVGERILHSIIITPCSFLLAAACFSGIGTAGIRRHSGVKNFILILRPYFQAAL
jgi:hypothetical protein